MPGLSTRICGGMLLFQPRVNCRNAAVTRSVERDVTRARRLAILGMVVVVCAACATAKPPASGIDRWWSDLKDYEEQLQRFRDDSHQLLDDFQALREEPSFPAVEEKVKQVAARVAGGDEPDPRGILLQSLYTMSIGGLVLFPRFLALSTQVVTLEATQAELERIRLDLRWRRITLEKQSPPGTPLIQPVGATAADPSLLEQPVGIPFRCVRHVVGNLEFANCY